MLRVVGASDERTAMVPAGGRIGPPELRGLVDTVLTALADGAADRDGPIVPGDPVEVADQVRDVLGNVLPEHGVGAGVLGPLTRMFARGAADPSDPACAAHLLCPPLALAAAADLAATALNADLSSWDEAPAGTVLEGEVVAALAGLVGFDPGAADGVITSGGTESNLMGLLLARDAALQRCGNTPSGAAHRVGELPFGGGRPRVFASRVAHFSIRRNAAVLGLGESSVVEVDVDTRNRMDPTALRAALAAAVDAGDVPVAVVATAGTTDFGSIDPLREIGLVAREFGAALHVDAAYGGGLLFSDRLSDLLDGIDEADTVSLDLHKFGWQPVGAGVFLARKAETFAPMAVQAAYLNPADDQKAGYVSLLGKSLRTTRRVDAFKIAVTLRALGKSGLGRMVDSCYDLARYAADRIDAQPLLELATAPELSTVLFRYQPSNTDPAVSDRVNAALRRRLLRSGAAVIGRTELSSEPGAVTLKLSLLNPWMTHADVDALIDLVLTAGAAEEMTPYEEEARIAI